VSAIVDPVKQLDPKFKPRCSFQIIYHEQLMQKYQQENRESMLFFMFLWAFYIFFVVVSTLYDILFWIIQRYQSQNDENNRDV